MSASALGLQDLVAAMPLAAAVIDRWGRIVCSNDAWERVADDLMHLFAADLELSPSASALRAVLDGTRRDGTVHLDLDDDPETGDPRFVQVRAVPIGEGDTYFLATCAFLDDADLESSVLLDRDTVTGVPGARLFCELVNQAMAMSGRYPYRPAVIAIEVDGLDEIEAEHGRTTRRELVVSMASRLRSGLRPSDVVAQPSPEEFWVLLPDIVATESAHEVAERLCNDHAQPFRIGEQRVSVSIRAGVALSESTVTADRLIEAAQGALVETRVSSDGVVDITEGTRRSVVTVSGDDRAPKRTVIGRERHIDLRDMKDEELVSFYQPIFDVHDGHVVAGEALMRWRHPHYGVLSAGEFLGLAINSGMLATLTDQALVRATETWADFHDRLGVRPPKLFVNLSPEQLLSRVAVDRLYHLLVATGLPSSDVVVEVTEEAMATKFGEMISVLNELRAQGLHVALDDFGSGYSSLGRLRHLPVDVIKVDQTMVRGLEADHRARQLLAAVSTMAKELDVDCIVEGIETAGEAQIVADLGFRFVQGYHFGRPTPAEDFIDLVVDRQVANRS